MTFTRRRLLVARSNGCECPYVQRDGMSNPANFVDHRKAMIRFSQIIGALASAYRLNPDKNMCSRPWFICKLGLSTRRR
nr:alginate lyase family protein [Sphingobacterium sp. E70]